MACGLQPFLSQATLFSNEPLTHLGEVTHRSVSELVQVMADGVSSPKPLSEPVQG